MALPSSGAISLGQVNTELGVSATATRSLNDSTTRTLFGVASGAISLSNGYGKANQFAFTIASNQTNANLRTLAVNAGWNQSSKVVATINSGVYISSNSTGTPALTVNGSFPGGVELINGGIIAGMGGGGGNGRGNVWSPGLSWTAGSAGAAGGLALSVASAVSITNNNTISGGGGGGGGGGAAAQVGGKYVYFGVGGGGGGGRTGLTNSSGGTRGSNYNGSSGITTYASNGGAGTVSSIGAGGAQASTGNNITGGSGGSGGAWGSSGASGGNGNPYNSSGAPYGGGSAGGAVAGNANITWVATGTRNGGIS